MSLLSVHTPITRTRVRRRCFSFFITVFYLIIPAFFLIPFFSSDSKADTVKLKWEQKTDKNISGFRIYMRQKNQSYKNLSPVWEGTTRYCKISGINEPGTYYFVARNYKKSGSESNNSNEVSYTVKDSDKDGISDKIEAASCTDPFDADSDDDGICDGSEDTNQNGKVEEGETDPCDFDSDNDNISDGTEIGITKYEIGPDTDLNIFIPDKDPDSTTDPLSDDTDGDGIIDGDEDSNRNGKVDKNEKDPNASEKSTSETDSGQKNKIIIDNKDNGAKAVGSWFESGAEKPYKASSLYSRTVNSKYVFSANLSGKYEVSLYWTEWSSRANKIPVEIYNNNKKIKTVFINQTRNCAKFNPIGTFRFSGKAKVVIISKYSSKSTNADAVKFIRK